MNVEIFNKAINSNELMADYRQKNIHLVCVAVNALTYFNVFATSIGGISNYLASELSSKVNRLNETGTLYPDLNLTIIPLTAFNDRNDFGNHEIMTKHIEDCFTANEQYLKCENVVFALEDRGDFDYNLALKVIIEVAAAKTNLVFTKSIFYIPYN